MLIHLDMAAFWYPLAADHIRGNKIKIAFATPRG
jgi:hypothetical protein